MGVVWEWGSHFWGPWNFPRMLAMSNFGKVCVCPLPSGYLLVSWAGEILRNFSFGIWIQLPFKYDSYFILLLLFSGYRSKEMIY